MHTVPTELQISALYVHVPFCAQRCGYCDFSLMAGREQRIAAYLAALRRELACFELQLPLRTVFLGGGTPSHLSDDQLCELLATLRAATEWPAEVECTLEANPNDVDLRRAAVWRTLGVNRLSLGVQSFHDAKLQRLQRTHAAAEAEARVAELVREGWNVSLDLIFGLADERLTDWHEELERAIALQVAHISIYHLTIEKGTQFYNRQLRGEIMNASEDLAVDLYESAVDRLQAAGYEHYEISNLARPGRACQHNLTYWRGEPWLGLGPGAASYAQQTRWRNHRSPMHYLHALQSGRSPVDECEQLSGEQAARERLIFGLRQIAGIDLAEFHRETGRTAHALGGSPLQKWLESGWLSQQHGRLALTRAGLLISDALWPQLI